MYKCLTSEEMETWNQRAVEDKARYDNEMEDYVPPPGHDAKGNLVVDDFLPAPKKPRKVKDPDAPKRARGMLLYCHDFVSLCLLPILIFILCISTGSFVFFTADERPRLMEEMPGISFVDLGTVMGERWRNLSSEEKRKYEEKAAQDKIRFNTEMQQYNANKMPASLDVIGTAPHESMYMVNMEHMQYDPNTYHHQQAYDHSAYQYH